MRWSLVAVLAAACGNVSPVPPGPPPAVQRDAVVLVVSPRGAGIPRLEVYSRQGELLRDLAASLPFTNATGLHLTVGQSLIYAAPAPSSRMMIWATDEVPGVTPATDGTQLLVRVEAPGGSRVIGLTATGAQTFDVMLPATTEWVRLTRAGGYLLGDDGARHGVVYDLKLSRLVWTGETRAGLCASDDSACYLTATGAEAVVERLELPSGVVTRHQAPDDIYSMKTPGSVFGPGSHLK